MHIVQYVRFIALAISVSEKNDLSTKNLKKVYDTMEAIYISRVCFAGKTKTTGVVVFLKMDLNASMKTFVNGWSDIMDGKPDPRS